MPSRLILCLIFSSLMFTGVHGAILNMNTGAITTNNGTNSTNSTLTSPNNGTSLADEIKCYNLPYGAIGFIGHLTNYWSIYWLGYSRRPYAPWIELSTAKFDLFLSGSQILSSSSIASYSIHRCRNRTPFILISVWKLIMSLEVGIWGVSAGLKARRDEMSKGTYKLIDSIGQEYKLKQEKMSKSKRRKRGLPEEEKRPLRPSQIWDKKDWTPYTLIFYTAGAITGMTGTINLTNSIWPEYSVVVISATFAAVFLFTVVVAILLRCAGKALHTASRTKFICSIMLAFVLACGLYSDWVLGAIAQNFVGTPPAETAPLYWAYFTAKRLPFLFN